MLAVMVPQRAQLGAAEMIQSCGPEIAEVLNQVDLLVAKKREEWDQELTNAVRREANEQKRIHQVRSSRYFSVFFTDANFSSKYFESSN